MNYKEAIDRLANHSNRPTNEELLPEDSLVFNLWKATRENYCFDVTDCVDDVISCLEVVNKHINGMVPSEGLNKKKPDMEIVYIVSMIIVSINEYIVVWQEKNLFDLSKIRSLSMHVWEISNAWCSILSGDIDSLRVNIELQRKAKGF